MLFTQAVLQLAVLKAKQGESVTLNFKFGKLRISRGETIFESEKLKRKPAQSALSFHRNFNDE